ncbi:DUF5313 domain-containing protein [Mycobacteroides franklinii]|uniref:DUF5313 domain-containing protein n=1 Tax=Mycobacteroides franklinii TaxID=948102 RepID=A0A4R8QYF2_9MYCO|nr:DUF5313 domain-containing protein [Mycobacteroides franklinii]TDZ45390.1 hypothetical protein CCUG64054_01036 [Mycobacteroides franklinii]TDZ48881.1 hypothetical protein CCUG63697_03413 [Mycobacteroides franklinii]TDZ59062.1 hypothetical protein CCUG63696_01040 [Mycobacteroides franklinii]TDZ66576.1 hypothetical protein CCUG63695_00402 [Mycobacteroides franklinii]TDZ72499.1 hypothetical protein CCUG64056_01036 [Mycobacteroides franklinii]
MTTDRPSIGQFITYAYGRRLPDSMRDWVANDLSGPGAVRRHMIRYVIPPHFILAPFWLLPGGMLLHVAITLPIYVWAILMTHALNKIWRRYRLAQHDLDPKLADIGNREKRARKHEAYAQRYGARPESNDTYSSSDPI